MFQYTNNEGISWDTGPTLISLPQEIKKLSYELEMDCPELLPVETGCHLNFANGDNWYLPIGLNNITNYFAQIDTKLTRELSEALQIASAIFDFAENNIFYRDPPSAISLGMRSFSSGLILKYPKLTLTPYRKVIDTLFSNNNMREFFYHFSSYVGMNPDEAQGGIISIAHVELVSPIVFPSNGVYQIMESLINTAKKYKVKINLNSEVVDANLVNERQIGQGWKIKVKNENKFEEIRKDIIVSNSDPYVASFSWLNATSFAKDYLEKIKNTTYRPSESQFVILYDWLDSSEISHHVKVFPESWRQSFIEVCENYRLPNDPCIYLVWPHATDKSISPRVLFISAMAPNNLSGLAWDQAMSHNYAQKILEQCRKRLNLKLQGEIFKLITPQELEQRAHSFKGGLYSACLKKFNPVSFHPSGVTRYENLYFVGAGIHPGAGVTMVMKSARRISKHIIETFKKRGSY